MEAFNSFALRYCPKLKDFKNQHEPRILSAVMDYNCCQFLNLAKYEDVPVDWGFQEDWRLEFLKWLGVIDKY